MSFHPGGCLKISLRGKKERGEDNFSVGEFHVFGVPWKVIELSSGILVLNSALRDARTRKFHLKSLPLPETHVKKPPRV